MTTEAIPNGTMKARKLSARLAIAILLITGEGVAEVAGGTGMGAIGLVVGLGWARFEGIVSAATGLAQARQ
jgi:hypothetical protein